MNSQHKVLLIDNAPDRKERINALKNRGYSVFPALNMDEARSRCLRGGYDLIVVNAGEQPDHAVEFCDDIRRNCPKQLLLLCSNSHDSRDYSVAADLKTLLEKMEQALPPGGSADYASAA